MKKLPFLILSLAVFACNSGKQEEQKAQDTTAVQQPAEEKNEVSLDLRWTTDTTLKTSESVLFDKDRNVLYVSNIDGDPSQKDKKGFIAKVSVDGQVENLNWVTGLNAPKGMGLSKGKLYVTDITALVEIDTESGKVIKKYEVPGAKFLNDIATGQDTVYFSDSETGKIHTFSNGKVGVWKEGFQGPNGLLVLNNTLYLASMGSNDFKAINMVTKADTVLATGVGMGDGVVFTGNDGQFIVSNWMGEVFFIGQDGQAKKILDTKDKKINSADIEYIAEKKLLLVPTFAGNSVQAYEVKM